MRLKSFRAATVAEAMKLVRDHFGDNAVIVSTHRDQGEDGVRVTAAVDDIEVDPSIADQVRPVDALDAIDAISQSLEFHGVPAALADRLLGIASNLLREDPASALAVALDAALGFEPLPAGRAERPLMLVGPPGSGKTVTLAKIAVRATFARQPVNVVTTDVVRAGGVDQLAAFTRLLELKLVTAEDPEALRKVVGDMRADSLILIDTAATNPYSESEMADLVALVRAVSAEPILVLSAGIDLQEAEEIAKAFRKIGCARMLLTRVDAARRLGAPLAAAHAARLKLCDMTNSPHVTQGLHKVTPLAMARLLLPDVSMPRDARLAPRGSAQPAAAAAARPAIAQQRPARPSEPARPASRPAAAAAPAREMPRIPQSVAERLPPHLAEKLAERLAERGGAGPSASRPTPERLPETPAHERPAPRLPDVSRMGTNAGSGRGADRLLPAPSPSAERGNADRPGRRPEPDDQPFDPPPRFLYERDPLLDQDAPPEERPKPRLRGGVNPTVFPNERPPNRAYADRVYHERQDAADRRPGDRSSGDRNAGKDEPRERTIEEQKADIERLALERIRQLQARGTGYGGRPTESGDARPPRPGTPLGGEAGGRPEGARPDAGRPDAGRPDAGRPDAGRPDAGRPDAGRQDGSGTSPGAPPGVAGGKR
ncbi:MAG: hypothetical protein JNK11_08260 [Alphaproteobacteria bacterium]|nr:hypothetical protein [Alphaproteobacteria bacterium]